MMAGPAEERFRLLTPEQARRRRTRSLAIAGGLAFLVVLFYAITIIKMAPGAGHGG